MKKTCEKCGKEFEPKEPHFKLCQNCFSNKVGGIPDLSGLLLRAYYDSDGQPLKQVYIDIPEKLANLFFRSKPQLALKQLREVHRKILAAKTKAVLSGIGSARYILYQCQRDLEYQAKRNVIPENFVNFMKHHLTLAEQDEKSLEGFFQHLDSIVCYFPVKKEKGGV